MQNFTHKISKWEHLWCKKNVLYWAFGWAALSLFTYLFFSGSAQSVDRPVWYRLFTAYILQNIPLLVAGLLCLRNGLSRRMPSGSSVWLLMGIAIVSFLIGNIFFSSWELVWHLNSTGSLGDPFFCIFYSFLSLAMVIAIASKRVRLNIYQWLIVAGISLYAATLVTWILKPPAGSLAATVPQPAAMVSQVQSLEPGASNNSVTTPQVTTPVSDSTPNAPGWVMFFDRIFKPYGQTLNSFYVWCDVALFILATTMILAFWGGRMSNAWQVNAQAIICFYIADMWYAYAGNQIKDYQGGFMLEVFWIFGAIQFAIAAVTEFEYMLSRERASNEYQE